MIRALLLCVLLAPSTAWGQGSAVACPAGQVFLLGKCYDPAGPGRFTLHQAPWGVVYTDEPGQQTLTTHARKVVTQAGEFAGKLAIDGRYVLTKTVGGKKLKLTVDPRRPPGTKITLGSRTFRIERLGSHIKLRSGATTLLSYQNTVGSTIITGTKGAVTITHSPMGNTEVSSAAGKTTISSTVRGDAAKLTPPLSAHPHLGRIVVFDLGGAGLVVDMWALAGLAPGVGALSESMLWETALRLTP